MNFSKLGNCRPGGRLQEIMRTDLDSGFIGFLDRLAPDIIVHDDIYHLNRRFTEHIALDLGTVEFDEKTAAQYQWWNAESQGNWLDGLIRTAILLKDKKSIARAEKLILHRLKDEKYIGIYYPEARDQWKNENGELWAKTTILRAAYALYCARNSKELLDRIIGAVDEIMGRIQSSGQSPFGAVDEEEGIRCCGISHGLIFTDVLYDCYKETGCKKYIEFASMLYESYSLSNHVESDAKKENLLDPYFAFNGHGVHTYEHLRAVALSKEKDILVGNYLEKLEKYLCPSGAPIGDEWILPEGADPAMTGYEYCSLHELMHSYLFLLDQSGDLSYADRAEWLFYNAALGARHPEKSLIAYLKSDNSYRMQSAFQFEQPHQHSQVQTRYKYSPTHQDVAVCCVPNAGRIFPYFVSSMWMEGNNSVMKVLYGDSVYENEDVLIEERSNFPRNNKIRLIVEAKRQKEFTLKLRIPKWCNAYLLEGAEAQCETQMISVTRVWSGITEITLHLFPEVIRHKDQNGEVYFTYGGMLLALPIESKEEVIKTYSVQGFHDYEYRPVEEYNYVVSEKDKVELAGGEFLLPLVQEASGRKERKRLVPLMETILRKVTFKEVKI